MTVLQSLLKLDASFSARMRLAEQPGLPRRLAAFLAHSGDSWFWVLGLGMLAWLRPGFWRWWALILLTAILGTAALVLTLKFTVRRRRPEGEWGQMYRRTDPHSFPSGHAARVSLIAVLTLGIGPFALGLALALWAALVALARVAMGVHYLSDILAGGILGILIGTGILHWLGLGVGGW